MGDLNPRVSTVTCKPGRTGQDTILGVRLHKLEGDEEFMKKDETTLQKPYHETTPWDPPSATKRTSTSDSL
jgi:hypothetical protein